MTEAEWLACVDPESMLEFLTNKVRDRKLRLFAVACCRRLGSLLSSELYRAVQVAERFADRTIGRDEFDRMESAVEDAAVTAGLDSAVWDAVSTAFFSEDVPFLKVHVTLIVGSRSAAEAESWGNESRDVVAEARAKAAQSQHLRDIFGNPFHPVTFDPNWRTSTAVAIAAQMYESRDFGAMPILADALQDAGCDNADILDHCRGPGPHVRGCWVVDLVLGKE